MSARPHFLRGYTNEWANTEPATMILESHRVIHLERDYWVTPEELADLASEDVLGKQVATAALFWAGITVIGAAFGAMTWMGWIPA